MKLKLPDFTKSKILVIGDIMLDRYWHGGAKRISPEAPVPVVNVNKIEERAGGAANVAFNLSTLGCEVTLQGFVGEDEAAKQLEKLFHNSKVDCQFIVDSQVPTITKLRVISQHQQLIRLDFEENISAHLSNERDRQFSSTIDQHDLVLLSDYGKGALNNVQTLIKIANEHKKPIIVDPKGNEFTKYKGATLITPNAKEFEAIVGECKNDQDVEIRGRNLLESLGLEALLVTRGEHGMSLIEKDQKALHILTEAREVFDVTGAGDTVISVLSAARSRGESFSASARLANAAAGIVVGKLGTASIDQAELRAALKGEQSHIKNIVTLERLKQATKNAKQQGKKIVMTNGCFDILHAGHIAYLEEARLQGDRLIVAVNSDESVSRLKGEQRPIVPLEQRMAVLAGLSSVDWVISFSEDTPEALIESILPDVLVKGGDYKVEEIAGHKAVFENGGEVKILRFEDGCSTSEIIEKIKETS